jgi:hypothetical protein
MSRLIKQFLHHMRLLSSGSATNASRRRQLLLLALFAVASFFLVTTIFTSSRKQHQRRTSSATAAKNSGTGHDDSDEPPSEIRWISWLGVRGGDGDKEGPAPAKQRRAGGGGGDDDIPEDVESDMTDFAPAMDGDAPNGHNEGDGGSKAGDTARRRAGGGTWAQLASRAKLTIVLMSYPKSSRFHVLEKIIRKTKLWTSFVDQILLVWNGDVGLLPPAIATLVTSNVSTSAEAVAAPPAAVPFRVLPQTANRVDNRWRIGRWIRTEAVLNMDDDVDLFEVGAQCMFNVWQSAPASLVAIDVRSHFRHQRDSGKALYGPWGYAARDQSDGHKKYSIALPRGLLTHRAYYLAYERVWRNASSGLRAVVDELLCDDIAFSFVASNTTALASVGVVGSGSGSRGSDGSRSDDDPALAVAGHPGVVYVKAKYETYPEGHGKDAMVHKPGMKAMRQKCVNRLSGDVFGGRMPLTHRQWHVLCDVDG